MASSFVGVLALTSILLFARSGAEIESLLSWGEAYSLARSTLLEMTPDEKYQLMRGIGWEKTWNLKKWWYVGNTPAIHRLNIPSLNMQDASAGFRPYWSEMVGTMTCWPSLLALGATWDPVAVRNFAEALGAEFRGKGANVILGPSVEVQRVARSGRNFEYLSGEDPYLGARLTEAYVRGVQSRGLFAVVKHWVGNHQETNRGFFGVASSSTFDEKTAWELYFPPIEAAVKAGVSAVMCSYNKVNGVPSCSNPELFHDLRDKMGFQGFVQTDWWAAHGSSVLAGVDQEMPGSGNSMFAPTKLAQQPPAAIDVAVTRILAAMHRHDLAATTRCTPPQCEQWLMENVTGDKHRELARSLAADSIVLLKNRGGVLPLSAVNVKTIAIIGAAATAKPFDPNGADQGEGAWNRGDYYSGGGSGHVLSSNTVTALNGIASRAFMAKMDVIASATNDVNSAVNAAAKADLAIVVCATSSGESTDRANLRLDGNCDALIDAVAVEANQTVVLLQVPGAVLMPWRMHVDGILLMFLGGQETGSAWADVLFGDVAPSARLPLMIPQSEADTIAPSGEVVVNYIEGLETSYRNKHFVAAYPFGHGLSYTTFQYFSPTAGSPLKIADCPLDSLWCVRVLVQNIGSRAGRTVSQLYLEFPYTAQQPSPILKGFCKTGSVLPGEVVAVTFALSLRDLSFYNSSRTCCSGCDSKHPFCSPVSGNCYSVKNRDYYETCNSNMPGCCTNCGGSGFCSPVSGICYGEKKKEYYENCSIQQPSHFDGWVMADAFVAHIGESSADIRATLPFVIAVQSIDNKLGAMAGSASYPTTTTTLFV